MCKSGIVPTNISLHHQSLGCSAGVHAHKHHVGPLRPRCHIEACRRRAALALMLQHPLATHVVHFHAVDAVLFIAISQYAAKVRTIIFPLPIHTAFCVFLKSLDIFLLVKLIYLSRHISDGPSFRK